VSIRDEKAADLAEILVEIGEEVTWEGEVYRALISEPMLSQELEIGGFAGTGDFTIKIPRAAFGDVAPKLGDLLGFQEQSFRITRVSNHPQFPMLVLVVTPAD
jgi:hypothetical protein